jgi:hypothetical protein
MLGCNHDKLRKREYLHGFYSMKSLLELMCHILRTMTSLEQLRHAMACLTVLSAKPGLLASVCRVKITRETRRGAI